MESRKALWAGYLGMTFFGISFLTLGSILPSLRESLGLDMAQASTLAGVLPFGVLLGSIIFGPWCDRYGYKLPFQTAAALVILGMTGLVHFRTMPWLVVCILLIGTGGGMLNGASDAIVADASDDRKRSSNLSILGVFYGMGAIFMPLLLGVFDRIPYTVILRYVSFILFIAFVYFSIIRFPAEKAKQRISLNDGLALVKKPVLLFFSFILFFQSALEGLCSNWIPTYLQDVPLYGLSSQRSLFVLMFVVIGITVSRIILSFVLLKFAPHKVLWIFLGISALGFVSLALGLPPMMATFFIGFGLGATFPIIVSYIGQEFKNLSGTAIGMALVIALAGNTLLNSLVGFLSIRVFPLYLLGVWALMTLLYGIMLKVEGKSILKLK